MHSKSLKREERQCDLEAHNTSTIFLILSIVFENHSESLILQR